MYADDADSFFVPEQLLHLLRDPSLAVQHSAYSLVTRIAAKHVSDLVVEVELDTDEGRVIDLPDELIKLLEARVSDEVLQTPEEYSSVRAGISLRF